MKALTQRSKRVAHAILASFCVDEFNICADEVLVRRNQPQLFELSREQRLLSRSRTHQQMIGADAVRILDESQAARGVRLRIAVDQQRVDFRSREGRG